MHGIISLSDTTSYDNVHELIKLWGRLCYYIAFYKDVNMYTIFDLTYLIYVPNETT